MAKGGAQQPFWLGYVDLIPFAIIVLTFFERGASASMAACFSRYKFECQC
jgi:hypothetical protein